MRLAKKLLQDAKASANIKSDDFFLDAAEEQPFVGVYGEEEEDLVTKTLQNELVLYFYSLFKLWLLVKEIRDDLY